MTDRKNRSVLTLGAIAALAALSFAPAAAADHRICSIAAAQTPQGVARTAWQRLGGADGPLGCPTSRAGRSQTFEHGSIARPESDPYVTLATYLHGGRLHVSVTSLGQNVGRYQIAVERPSGADTFWNFASGTSSTLVADLPEGSHNEFHVKLYPCQVTASAFTAAALVCDRSEASTAITAPLELAMDPASPHVNPTGAVALRH